MNWITISWPMVAAACLTLGLIELRIGLAQPPRAARLLFALSAFAMAGVFWFGTGVDASGYLGQWWTLMRWLDLAVGVMLVSLMAFIWTYFGTGRQVARACGSCLLRYRIGVRLFALGASRFGHDLPNHHRFQNGRDLRRRSFNVVEGVTNPWNIFPYLAVLALIAFVVDASVQLWRHGGRRRALVVGGAIVFFFLAASLQAALVETGLSTRPT